jgi:hypothetical protein
MAKSMVKELTAFIPRLEEVLGDAYDVKGGWAVLCAFLGREDDARRRLKEAESIRGEHYVSPVDIATAHMFLGEIDESFKWFDIAYDERSAGLEGMKVEPVYDPIRADPRYAALLKKVGLDH